MRRRGFSLAELMVALVVAGVIGIALTRLLINQSRFVAGQDGYMRARASARAGFNALVSELRNVGDGGLLTASADSVTVRMPFAAGVTCSQPSGGAQAVLLAPYDSTTFADAVLRGYAWRDSAGTWNIEDNASVATGAATSDCTGATPRIPTTISPATSITTSSPGSGAFQVVRLTPNNSATPNGAPVYLFQRVRYAIAASTEIAGRQALWRTNLETGVREEMVTPLASASSFRFLVGGTLRAQTAVPADLDSVMGLRVRLVGESEERPEGRSTVTEFALTTDIVFVNRVR